MRAPRGPAPGTRWPSVALTAARLHLGLHFAEVFHLWPADLAPVSVHVSNHLSSWDAELAMACTLATGRDFAILADSGVLRGRGWLRHLGLVELDRAVLPVVGVKRLVRAARERAPISIWVMPQRSHWPVASTRVIDYPWLLFGRYAGPGSVVSSSIDIAYSKGRRPFGFVCTDAPDPGLWAAPDAVARAAFRDEFLRAPDRHASAFRRADPGTRTLLRPGEWGLTGGVPTSLRDVRAAAEGTGARLTSALPVRLAYPAAAEPALSARLDSIGRDRARSILADSSRE